MLARASVNVLTSRPCTRVCRQIWC